MHRMIDEIPVLWCNGSSGLRAPHPTIPGAQHEYLDYLYDLGAHCSHCDRCFDAMVEAELTSVHPRPALQWYLRLHHGRGLSHIGPPWDIP